MGDLPALLRKALQAGRLTVVTPKAENPSPFMYFAYVLRSCKDNTRYVGSTKDKEIRLKEHNSGRVRYTKGKLPWKLIYFEDFKTRSEARKREAFLKSGQGRKFLDNLRLD